MDMFMTNFIAFHSIFLHSVYVTHRKDSRQMKHSLASKSNMLEERTNKYGF